MATDQELAAEDMRDLETETATQTHYSGPPSPAEYAQAPGRLMEDPPTPDTGEIPGIADWQVNSWNVSVYPDSNGHPAMIHIENRTRMSKPYVFNSQKAREFGEAMIAAADYAEQEQDNE